MNRQTQFIMNSNEESYSIAVGQFIEKTTEISARWLLCEEEHHKCYGELEQLKEEQVRCYNQWPNLFSAELEQNLLLAAALDCLSAIMASIDTISGRNEYQFVAGFDDETTKRQSVYAYWKERLNTSAPYQSEVARMHGLQIAK